jgi:hypothetical protein
MACEQRLRRWQSLQQRATEIREVAALLARRLAAGQAKAIVGPQGAIAFTGLTEAERKDVTDGCLYRRILASGSALAKHAIARAEALAGRTVDKRAVAQGIHSHDGTNWHLHKG